jgi:hypothetical protein
MRVASSVFNQKVGDFFWTLLLGHDFFSGLLKKSFLSGCSKMPRCKAPEILRSEAPAENCRDRNDEG